MKLKIAVVAHSELYVVRTKTSESNGGISISNGRINMETILKGELFIHCNLL